MNKATQLSSQNNTLNLDIEGMTCAACAARIERVISKQEDVLDVSVSFPLKSAIVDIKNNDEFDDHSNNEVSYYYSKANSVRGSISQSGIDARNYAMKSIKPILDEIIQVTDHLTKKSLLADLRSFRESIEKNRV